MKSSTSKIQTNTFKVGDRVYDKNNQAIGTVVWNRDYDCYVEFDAIGVKDGRRDHKTIGRMRQEICKECNTLLGEHCE